MELNNKTFGIGRQGQSYKYKKKKTKRKEGKTRGGGELKEKLKEKSNGASPTHPNTQSSKHPTSFSIVQERAKIIMKMLVIPS